MLEVIPNQSGDAFPFREYIPTTGNVYQFFIDAFWACIFHFLSAHWTLNKPENLVLGARRMEKIPKNA